MQKLFLELEIRCSIRLSYGRNFGDRNIALRLRGNPVDR
jgi:hypothetical protein